MFIASRNNTTEDPTIPMRPGWEGMHVWWLIERQHGGSEHAVFNVTVFPPNKAHEVHRHAHAEEFLYVLQGSGLHLTDGEPVRLQEGEVVFIPMNEWHGFANDMDTPTTVITVMGGVGSYQDAGYEVLLT
jgi:quercetin dioxygenase-like cupin family protein